MHNQPSYAIELNDAAVRRGERAIWQHGTFAIPTGSVTAIVGTNGAGKTTMMKVELGLLPLSHGSATVLGAPARPGQRFHRLCAAELCRRHRIEPHR